MADALIFGVRFARIKSLGLLGLCTLLPALSLKAGELVTLPAPGVTIYPGDIIKDSWLVDHEYPSGIATTRGDIILNRAAIVGKIARRTLLPGAPIPSNAVADPKIVANGAKVRIVFEEEGLTITAYAAALQAGGVGEVISLRNLDSGLTISGTVQPDGSVRVGGG